MQQQQNVCPQHLLNLPHSCAKACRISGLAHSAQHTGMQHRQSVQNVTLHPIVSANRPLPLESKAQVKDQSSELPDIVRSFMAPMTIKSTPTTSKRVVEDGGLVKRYDWGFSMSLLICSSFQTFHYFCRQTYIYIYIYKCPKNGSFFGVPFIFPNKKEACWTNFLDHFSRAKKHCWNFVAKLRRLRKAKNNSNGKCISPSGSPCCLVGCDFELPRFFGPSFAPEMDVCYPDKNCHMTPNCMRKLHQLADFVRESTKNIKKHMIWLICTRTWTTMHTDPLLLHKTP